MNHLCVVIPGHLEQTQVGESSEDSQSSHEDSNEELHIEDLMDAGLTLAEMLAPSAPTIPTTVAMMEAIDLQVTDIKEEPACCECAQSLTSGRM